jgi:hypothetical protein
LPFSRQSIEVPFGHKVGLPNVVVQVIVIIKSSSRPTSWC